MAFLRSVTGFGVSICEVWRLECPWLDAPQGMGQNDIYEGYTMRNAILRLFLRCSHRHLTRPITPVSQQGVTRGGTYVVCLDCGTQFPYDWENMRMGRPDRRSRTVDVWQHTTQEPRW